MYEQVKSMRRPRNHGAAAEVLRPRTPSSRTFFTHPRSIYELPECITELVHLTSLNLDANEIHRLPIGMGNLHLKLLKVSHGF